MITIEQAASYLPYNTQFMYNDEVYDLDGVDVNGDVFSADMGEVPMHMIKLILNPLSKLSRVEGDITEHSINLLLEEEHGLDYGVFSAYKNELDFQLDGDPTVRYDQNKDVSFEVFLTVQRELLKGHFDIYGLINNNLALEKW